MSIRETLLTLAPPAMAMHESYAATLVDDLDEARMDHCPGPGHENTPRFTLGHLCCAAALTVWVLEGDREGGIPDDIGLPAVYDALFRRLGPGDRRTPGADGRAPSREALVAQFRAQHERVVRALEASTDESLGAAYEWKLGHHLPTVAHVVMFQIAHEGLHLGQLASWRRAMGLPAAMARMVAERV